MSLRGMWKAEKHVWVCQGQGWHLGYWGEVEGECSDLATDPSPWSPSSSSQSGEAEINSRDQRYANYYYFSPRQYQILVVRWYLWGSAVSGTAFQAEAMQNHEIGFGSVLYLWETCIWFFAFQTFEPLVSMCDSILGVFSNLSKSLCVRFLDRISYWAKDLFYVKDCWLQNKVYISQIIARS